MDAPSSVGVLASYGHAWQLLKRYLVRLSLLSLIPYLLQGGCAVSSLTGQDSSGSGPLAAGNQQTDPGAWDLHGLLGLTPLGASVVLMDSTLKGSLTSLTHPSSLNAWPLPPLWTFLVFAPLTYALAYVCVVTARGEKPSLQVMFYRPNSLWSASIIANIVIAFLLLVAELPAVVADYAVMRPHLAAEGVTGENLIWLAMPALFSIPCLVVGMRLALTPFLICDEELGAIDAIKASWMRTSGHMGTLFGICLLGVPVLLLGLACLIVGVIPAAVWIELAFASFYVSVIKQQELS